MYQRTNQCTNIVIQFANAHTNNKPTNGHTITHRDFDSRPTPLAPPPCLPTISHQMICNS